jgi:obg-like ATPase 1
VEKHKPKSEVKAFVTVVDIAGLISGASNGEGLGNAFLSHISAVDGLVHVLRAFEDDDVIHAEDTVDPVRDINTIMNELRIKDLSLMKNKHADLKKNQTAARAKSPLHLKKWEEEMATMDKIIECLEADKDIKNNMENWTSGDIEFLNDYQLLTGKPSMFVINMNKRDYCRKKNKFLKPIFDWVNKNSPGSAMIPYCGAYEEELQDMDEAARVAQLKEDETTSAMNKMLMTAFHMVHLINFFTCGPDEVRAWIVRKGYKAPQAAGVIHTDFEKKFIMAEVMTFDVLKELGSEAEVKAAGKYRQEGKAYEIQDGDVVLYKIGK